VRNITAGAMETLFLINRQAFIYGLEFQDSGRFSLFRIGIAIAFAQISGFSGLKNDNSIIIYSQKMTFLLLIIITKSRSAGLLGMFKHVRPNRSPTL